MNHAPDIYVQWTGDAHKTAGMVMGRSSYEETFMDMSPHQKHENRGCGRLPRSRSPAGHRGTVRCFLLIPPVADPPRGRPFREAAALIIGRRGIFAPIVLVEGMRFTGVK